MLGMSNVILGGEAVAAGVVTRHELRRDYTVLYRGVFLAKKRTPTLRDRAIGAWLATRRRGVVAGVAASGLHGVPPVDPDHPIEVAGVTCGAQPGLIPRAEPVADDETVLLCGLPVTTLARTAFDVARHLDRADALARLDALMWHAPFDLDDVAALAERYPRAHGLRQLQELLPLVDGGAASMRESGIRLWLHDAGLPRPLTAVSAGDTTLEMAWPGYQVAVESRGDDTRTRMLTEQGWIVIRVGVDEHPHDWLARVCAALVSRGCPIAPATVLPRVA